MEGPCEYGIEPPGSISHVVRMAMMATKKMSTIKSNGVIREDDDDDDDDLDTITFYGSIFVLTPISLRSILILSSHLRLGLSKGLFPVGPTLFYSGYMIYPS